MQESGWKTGNADQWVGVGRFINSGWTGLGYVGGGTGKDLMQGILQQGREFLSIPGFSSHSLP